MRLYIRLEGLAKTYVSARIIGSPDTVRSFFRGFNEVYTMFEAVDAGNDKEGADAKVKRRFTYINIC